MRVTNIADVRDLINLARSGLSTPSSNLVTLVVDKGAASGETIGKLGDARFLLKTEGVEPLKPGSTIQVDVQSGEISAVLPPKSDKDAPSAAKPKSTRASPSTNLYTADMC